MLREWQKMMAGFWLTALLLVLIFPPFAGGADGRGGGWLSWLAYVALVPASVVAVRTKKPGVMALWAWVIFSAWWGYVGRWMMPVTVGGHVATSVMMGGKIALCWWCLAQVSAKSKWPLVVLLPIFWVGLEVTRATIPFGGMNWFTLAQSQQPLEPGRVSWVVQMADIAGWPLVTGFVALVNGVIADFLTRPIYGPRVGRRKPMLPAARLGLFALTVSVVFALGYGQASVSQSQHTQQPGPVIGLVQTNIPQDNKTARTLATDEQIREQLIMGSQALLGPLDLKEHRLDRSSQASDATGIGVDQDVTQGDSAEPDSLTRTKATRHPDWLVWPETTTVGPLDQAGHLYWIREAQAWAGVDASMLDPAALKRVAEINGVAPEQVPDLMRRWYGLKAQARLDAQQVAIQGQVALIAGSSRQAAYPQGASFNSAFVFQPAALSGLGVDDLTAAVYDKQHRVPFGEYLPVVDRFPAIKQWVIQTLTPYDHDYALTAGQGAKRFELGFVTEEALIRVDEEPAHDRSQTNTQSKSQSNAQSKTQSNTQLGTQHRTAVAVTPICFEDTVASLCRDLIYENGQKKADILVNLTNDGWFAPAASAGQADQHMQLAALRCVENRVPMVRAVNTGVSGWIDANGQVLGTVNVAGQRLSVAGAQAMAVTLDSRQGVFAHVGMGPAWGVMGLTWLFWAYFSIIEAKRVLKTGLGFVRKVFKRRQSDR